MVGSKIGLVSGIVTCVVGGISAICAVVGLADNLKNGDKRAELTGRACGEAYAITKDMLEHPEKYKKEESEQKEVLEEY